MLNIKSAALLAISACLLSAAPVYAQATGVPTVSGRAYNIRRYTQTAPTITGVRARYNNGTSALSTAIPLANPPSGQINLSQASFNTWAIMTDNNAPASGECYAELNVVKRVSNALVSPQNATFSGVIYAVTSYDAVQNTNVQKQYKSTTTAAAQGGTDVELVINSAGSLKGFVNSTAVPVTINAKCRKFGGGTYTPGGFTAADWGFEANNTGGVWTNGASIGNTQLRTGAGSFAAPGSLSAVPSYYGNWQTSYGATNNGGTIIMTR